MTLEDDMAKFNRAYVRAYCGVMPRPYRRQLMWTIDWLGAFGLPVAALLGMGLRALERVFGEPAA